MLFQVSCAAPNAETFTAESYGITEANTPQCGDAVPELTLVPASAMPTIGEAELQDATVKAINKALGGREDMMKGLQENIKKILSERFRYNSSGNRQSIIGTSDETAKESQCQKEL